MHLLPERRAPIIGGLCLLAIGCSSSFQVRRAERATVVDARTGAPIVGAAVIVESWRVVTPSGKQREREDVYSTRTDLTGHFEVPALMQTFRVIPLPDLAPAFNRRICVSVQGYQVAVADPWADAQSHPWQFEFPLVYKLVPEDNADAHACPFGQQS